MTSTAAEDDRLLQVGGGWDDAKGICARARGLELQYHRGSDRDRDRNRNDSMTFSVMGTRADT